VTPSESANESERAVPMAGGSRQREVPPASGIYGLIVTASVLATAGVSMRTAPLAVAVFVTLVVYWLAEEYAALGEHASAGHLPTWPRISSALAAKWPMVSASYIPLIALLAARVIGATTSAAALIALGVTVALLMLYGWKAGRSAGLRGLAQLSMAVAAGALGILMILLKVILVHLH
jgi:hypothetical protein